MHSRERSISSCHPLPCLGQNLNHLYSIHLLVFCSSINIPGKVIYTGGDHSTSRGQYLCSQNYSYRLVLSLAHLNFRSSFSTCNHIDINKLGIPPLTRIMKLTGQPMLSMRTLFLFCVLSHQADLLGIVADSLSAILNHIQTVLCSTLLRY